MKLFNRHRFLTSGRFPGGIALACIVFTLVSAISLVPLPVNGQGLADGETYKSSMDFIRTYLSEDAESETRILWLTGDLKERAAEILGHRFSGLRVRYWGESDRTLWVLEEIGKELPITIGVVIEGNKVLDIQILEYREVRGGEVRYPFFTNQFKGLTLDPENQNRLNGHVDGITGATLSVAAVRKIAILALVFHQQTPFGSG